jgi:ATP-dependent helicase/nuclease subunit B
VERVFIGWERNFLPSVCQYLLEHYKKEYSTGPALALDNSLLVLPTRRAVRRLTDLLLTACLKNKITFLEPEFHTPGSLPGWLFTNLTNSFSKQQKHKNQDFISYKSEKVLNQTQSILLMLEAINRIAKERLQILSIKYVPTPGTETTYAIFFELAHTVLVLGKELFGANLTFQKVKDYIKNNNDAEILYCKWDVLHEIYEQYLSIIHTTGKIDPLTYHFSLKNIYGKDASELLLNRNPQLQSTTNKNVILLGVHELIQSTVDLLHISINHDFLSLKSLVFAPAELHQGFTEYGTLNTSFWYRYQPEYTLDDFSILDHEMKEPAKVLDILNKLPQYNLNEITIGIGNPQTSSLLQNSLKDFSICNHLAAGSSLNKIPLITLLQQLLYFAKNEFNKDLLSLIKHPLCSRFLEREFFNKFKRSITPVSVLEKFFLKYSVDTLQDAIKNQECRYLDTDAYTLLLILKNELLIFFGNEKLTLQSAASRLMLVIEKLTATNDLKTSSDLLNLEPVFDKLQEIYESQVIHEPVTLNCFLDFFLRILSEIHIPEEFQENSLEILGWLELSLDDAKALIITGFNDGRVPGSNYEDAYLPDSLREALCLPSDTSRFARDNYLLATLLNSKEYTHFICSKFDKQNTPLMPSRLLYTTSKAAQKVILLFYEKIHSSTLAAHKALVKTSPSEKNLFIHFVTQPTEKVSLTTVSATGITDYLQCPFRFYLKHILKIPPLSERTIELQPYEIGTLLHKCLSDFGNSSLTKSTAADVIYKFLNDSYDTLIKKHFSYDLSPIIEFQLFIAKKRLSTFAEWQAEQVQEGWNIVKVEYPLTLPFNTFGQDNLSPNSIISARIDRIDYHSQTNTLRIIDYKFSDKDKIPESTHRYGPRLQKKWKNLQLPVYYFGLLQELKNQQSSVLQSISQSEQQKIVLAFFNLSGNTTPFVTAEWTEEDLFTAKQCINKVLLGIHEGCFWPANDEYTKINSFDPYALLFPEEGDNARDVEAVQ